MNFYEELEKGHYGSIELQRYVGPNLLRGLAISLLIHFLVVIAPYVVNFIRGEEIPEPTNVIVLDPTQLTKLLRQQNTPEQIKIERPKIAPPKAAKPVAVAKEEIVDEQIMIPTQQDIAASVGADTSLNIDAGTQVVIKEELEGIPDAGTFTPYEVAPQPLPNASPQPDFPELAKTAGVTGKVVVQVYVDKKGEVKKYKIVQAKPEKLGFEEEVEKVINKWKFTPAIQQGNPVGVWISIPFNFKYKK